MFSWGLLDRHVREVTVSPLELAKLQGSQGGGVELGGAGEGQPDDVRQQSWVS